MKFNIASTYRMIIKTYFATIIILIITNTTLFLEKVALYNVLLTALIICVFWMFIGLIMVLYKLFITRLVSKGGYLTLALPVLGIQVFFAQLLTGVFWILMTTIVYNVVIVITLASVFMYIGGYWYAIPIDGSFAGQISSLFIDSGLLIKGVIWVLAEIPVLLLFSCYACASVLLSVIFVNSGIIKRYKVITGILTFFAISLLFSPITEVLLVKPVEVNGINIDEIFRINIGNEIVMPFLDDLKNIKVEIDWFKYGGSFLFYIPITAGMGFLSAHLLERRFELK
jgi:hypothetical protein